LTFIKSLIIKVQVAATTSATTSATAAATTAVTKAIPTASKTTLCLAYLPEKSFKKMHPSKKVSVTFFNFFLRL